MRNFLFGKSRSATFFAATLVAMLVALPAAFAAKVFLNGVEISRTNISDRNLSDVDRVLIDDSGDVHIVAPGYDIQVENSGSGTSPRNAEAMAYVIGEPYIALFVNENAGSVPYEITLKVNGVTVQKFDSDRRTTAIDVSGYVKLGSNDVQIIAGKVGSRRGQSSDAQMRLLVGPGSNDGHRATVRRIQASINIDASETDRRVVAEQSFQVQAKDAE